MLEPVYK